MCVYSVCQMSSFSRCTCHLRIRLTRSEHKRAKRTYVKTWAHPLRRVNSKPDLMCIARYLRARLQSLQVGEIRIKNRVEPIPRSQVALEYQTMRPDFRVHFQNLRVHSSVLAQKSHIFHSCTQDNATVCTPSMNLRN